MDKFESKAKEILAEVEQLLAEEKECKSSESQFDYMTPPALVEQKNEFMSVLMKTQTLFYCTDPAMPLYSRSLALEQDLVGEADKREYELIKLMLQTYLDFLGMLPR